MSFEGWIVMIVAVILFVLWAVCKWMDRQGDKWYRDRKNKNHDTER